METKTIEGIFIDRELVEEGARQWSLWCQRAPDLYSVIMKTILYKVFSTFPCINHCPNSIRNMKKRFSTLTSLLNLSFSSRSCGPRSYKNFAVIAWALDDPQTLLYRSESFLPTRSLFPSILLVMTSLYFISPMNRWPLSVRVTRVECTPGEFLVILQPLSMLQLTSRRILRV